MANETAIRAAAISLLVSVIIVSYLQWGKGIDEIEQPTMQEFKSPEQIAMAAAADKKKGKKKNNLLPAGGGFAEGEEGPEGGENVAPRGDGTAPGGAGWTEGQEGPEGSEGAIPGNIETPAGGGWKEGEEGPEGSEGIMPEGEPASGSALGLCWKKPRASKKYSYRLSGSVATEAFPGEPGPLKEWAVVAVNQPISKWTAGSIVEVHGLTAGIDPEFSLEFTSAEKALHLCAVWPRSFGEFQGIRLAACLPNTIDGGQDTAALHGDLKLKPSALSTKLLIISGSDFGDSAPREGMVRREISGTVEATGITPGSFMVAAAASPVLDEEESQDNPRAVRMADASGRFSMSYTAPQNEPLYLCAMAFAKGQKVDAIKEIEGQGCTQLELPTSAPKGVVKLVDAQVSVNAQKMPLAPHERDHLALVERCYSGR